MDDIEDHGGARVAASLRYHALGSLIGEPGVAVTFDDGDRFGTGAIVILDRHVHGSFACLMQVDPDAGLADALLRAVVEWETNPHPVRDRDAVSRAFPGPDDPSLADSAWEILDEEVVPFRDAQRAAARAFLRQADVPRAMREALHVALDRGVPRAVDGLRLVVRDPGSPPWAAFAFAVANPMVARLMMRDNRTRDAMERRPCLDVACERWPGLTQAHLDRIAATGETLVDRLRDRNQTSADEHADVLVGVLARLPPEWIPDRRGMGDFAMVAFPVSTLSGRLGLDVMDLLGPGGGDWKARLATLRERAGAKGRPWGDMGAEDAIDVTWSLADAVVTPLLARHLTVGGGWPDRDGMATRLERLSIVAATGLAYGRKSLVSILDVSRDWHARREAISMATRASAASIAWPPLLPEPVVVGDFTFVPVHDFAGLQAEGAGGTDGEGLDGLDHCVASRLPILSEGMSHVLSVRTRDAGGAWVRHSTLQVRVGPIADGRHWMVVEEHRGLDNSDPSPEALQATSALSTLFQRGEVAPVPEALVIRKTSGDGRIEVACGYDWTDEASVLAAVRAWADFLPRWTRGLDAAALVEAMVANGCLPAAWRGDVEAQGMRAAA